MTFKQKVILLPAVASAFLLLILLVAVALEHGTGQVYGRIAQGYTPALVVARKLEVQALMQHHQVLSVLADPQRARREPLQGLAQELKRELDRLPRNPVLEPARTQALQEAYSRYWRQALRALEQAQGGVVAPEAQAALEPLHTALVEALRELGNWSEQGLTAAYAEAVRMQRWRRWGLSALVGVCILVLGVLGVWVVRQVVRPLGRLAEVASRIATEGDLTQSIEVPDTEDEIGLLARSLQGLVLWLRELPASLQEVLDELAGATERLKQAAQGQLDILTSQSRNLSEVGSTMSEIAQTTSQAASRAEAMLKVAAQADDFSTAGRLSIEGSAARMQYVRDRVETLLRGVTRLSEQAARAGEIVGSVRDLADQSNVLALNASIEAARAGEEGRGFAVVAREIRALSGQSLQSTQRISQILLEIHKAVREAVSVAEGGSLRLEDHIQQVLGSADRLGEINRVLQESAYAARQIVASVAQQNMGIEEMKEAMASLSRMMVEVESSTASTKEVAEQVDSTLERLREVVASFRL
jgi:methyl-accepting chemotaxis protein